MGPTSSIRVLTVATGATLLIGLGFGIAIGARKFRIETADTKTAVQHVTQTETVVRVVASPHPRTLLVLHVPGWYYVDAVAANDSWLAWRTHPRGLADGCRTRIHVLSLASRRIAALGKSGCDFEEAAAGPVLAGDRLIWSPFSTGNTEVDGTIKTAALRSHSFRVVKRFDDSSCDDDCAAPSIASDGRSVVISTGDAVETLETDLATPLFQGAYTTVAVAGSTVAAITPSVPPDPSGDPATDGYLAGSPASIELHALRAGSLIRTIQPAGDSPGRLALSATRLVVLNALSGDRARLDAYELPSGRRLWSRVEPSPVAGFALTALWLVVGRGEHLFLLDPTTGASIPFVRTDGEILSLDVAEDHAVWAEQLGEHRVRFRAVSVPG